MKMINDHLGEIIIALVIFGLIFAAVFALRGPIDNFFDGLKEPFVAETEPDGGPGGETEPDDGDDDLSGFTPYTYEVRYRSNGGTGTMENSVFTSDVVGTLSANAFSRVGYSFYGWSLSAGGNAEIAFADLASVKNLADEDGVVVDLYAVWKPNTYFVAFDPNGGTGAMDRISMTYGKMEKLPKNTFVRNGYTFKRWQYKGATYTDQQVVRNLATSGTVTLSAQWEIIPYNISYILNGGTMSAGYPSSYTVEDAVAVPNPTKEGYIFKGWTDDKGSAAQIDMTIPNGTTGNKVFIATWEKEEIVAQALFSADDNSLTFVRRPLYSAGDTFVDRDGKAKTVTAVYLGFEENSYGKNPTPWHLVRKNVKTVVVEDRIIPTSTTRWFYEFMGCHSFDLVNLDTSEVTQMASMFTYAGERATSFNIKGLDKWSTSKVTDMRGMFAYAGGIAATWDIGDLSGWDTSKVTHMGSMFKEAGSSARTWDIGDLSGWSVSTVSDMAGMFAGAGWTATTWDIGDLSGWSVSNVRDMSSMFQGAGHSAATWNVGDLSRWDVSNVTNMHYMFESTGSSASAWSVGNIGNWNVSKVTNMDCMFQDAGKNAATWNVGNLGGWDVSNVREMQGMFRGAGMKATIWNVGQLDNWDTSNVTDMMYMFYHAGASASTWNIGNLNNWNVSKVTDMSLMFYFAGNKADTWNIGQLDNWNTSNVTHMTSMFAHAGASAASWDIGNLSKWNTSKVKDMHAMFGCAGETAYTWNVGDLSRWDVSNVTDMHHMFYMVGANTDVFDIGNLNGWNTSKVTDMAAMFGCAGSSATTWNVGDLSGWDVSNVVSMCEEAKYDSNTGMYAVVGMFQDAGKNAATWNVGDLSKWDVAGIKTMDCMFMGAGKKASYTLDLSDWNVDSVTSWDYFDRGVESKVIEPTFR